MEGRSQTEEKAREHRYHKREEQDRCVEHYLCLVWDCVLWNKGKNCSEGAEGHAYSEQSAADREHQAFGQQLTHESRASGTERSPDDHLLLPRAGT